MTDAMMVGAARAMTGIVGRHAAPMTLKQLKAATLPRSSWEHFADVCLTGHRAGVLTLSRIDLPNVYGTPEETGEIEASGATFHWVKPKGWLG